MTSTKFHQKLVLSNNGNSMTTSCNSKKNSTAAVVATTSNSFSILHNYSPASPNPKPYHAIHQSLFRYFKHFSFIFLNAFHKQRSKQDSTEVKRALSLIIVVVSRQLKGKSSLAFVSSRCSIWITYYHIEKSYKNIFKLVRLMGVNGVRDEFTRASRTRAASTSVGGT